MKETLKFFASTYFPLYAPEHPGRAREEEERPPRPFSPFLPSTTFSAAAFVKFLLLAYFSSGRATSAEQFLLHNLTSSLTLQSIALNCRQALRETLDLDFEC